MINNNNMREIKFRAWDGKRMLDNPTFEFFNHGRDGRAVMMADENENVEIMQYTGLKDKNGKEIYEGDVVEGQKDFYPRSVIGFEDGSFVIKQTPLAKWKVSHFELKVIGNIYESPELITNHD